jgi:hypothetical protein
MLLNVFILALICSITTRLPASSLFDSTPLKVCHNRRIYRHKVFKGYAERGKSSTGWFYGLKLHLIINDRGEIWAFF